MISSDNVEFIIKREHAMVSGIVKAMLNGPYCFTESETNVIEMKDIGSNVLEKVCHYMAYKYKYNNGQTEIPPFEIDPDISLELLMASNFLNL